MSAADDRTVVLKFLYDRLTSGDRRYVTARTIINKTGIVENREYLYTLTDNLIQRGYVSAKNGGTNPANGRHFQITPEGVDFVERTGVELDSREWTGRSQIFEIDEKRQAEIVDQICHLRSVIDKAPLSNVERSQAIAYTSAALLMAEAPEPAWHLVRDALAIVAAISTALAFAADVGMMIR